MSDVTPLRATADRVLGGRLDEFVYQRRKNRLSWQVIASDLRAETDGVIDVTRETLRQWYGGMGKGRQLVQD